MSHVPFICSNVECAEHKYVDVLIPYITFGNKLSESDFTVLSTSCMSECVKTSGMKQGDKLIGVNGHIIRSKEMYLSQLSLLCKPRDNNNNNIINVLKPQHSSITIDFIRCSSDIGSGIVTTQLYTFKINVNKVSYCSAKLCYNSLFCLQKPIFPIFHRPSQSVSVFESESKYWGGTKSFCNNDAVCTRHKYVDVVIPLLGFALSQKQEVTRFQNPNSAIEESGLKIGDRLMSINNRIVRSMDMFRAELCLYAEPRNITDVTCMQIEKKFTISIDVIRMVSSNLNFSRLSFT